MVAKSYQTYKQIGEPYQKNNRMYVQIEGAKGIIKEVRWYTDNEYRKMYPEDFTSSGEIRPLKEVLGFEHGFITIFKGDTYAELDWFRQSNARYNKTFGWYVISSEPLPEDIPEGITPVKLSWSMVSDESGKLKSEKEMKAVIDSIIYEKSVSGYQGDIGERLDLYVTVLSATQKETMYGYLTTHIFEDEEKNRYMWATTAKTWAAGSKMHIRGTVKEHTTYRNVKTTVLNRCTEIKDK